jgi:hypothetical protein
MPKTKKQPGKQRKAAKAAKDKEHRHRLVLARLQELKPKTAKKFAEDERAFDLVRKSFKENRTARAHLRKFYTEYNTAGLPVPTEGRNRGGRFAGATPSTHFVEEFPPTAFSEEAKRQLLCLKELADGSFAKRSAGVFINVSTHTHTHTHTHTLHHHRRLICPNATAARATAGRRKAEVTTSS